MTDLQIDFVVYLGDPDDGAEALPSRVALARKDEIKDKLDWPEVYGAIVVSKGDSELLNHRPDPVLPLVTALVKSVPYVIDGELETALLTESEHGFALEPGDQNVTISFFAGDAFEPDEFLLEPTLVPLQHYGQQVLDMGRRLRELMMASDSEIFDRDDYSHGLLEFLEEGEKRFKTFQLQVERGLRA